MGRERRTAERVRINLPASLETASDRRGGTVSDISTSGCFMLSNGSPAPGDQVRVALALPGGDAVNLLGEVVYNTEEIGFAMRFVGGDESERVRLAEFIAVRLAERSAPPGKLKGLLARLTGKNT